MVKSQQSVEYLQGIEFKRSILNSQTVIKEFEINENSR
jgi:hypothetical protein